MSIEKRPLGQKISSSQWRFLEFIVLTAFSLVQFAQLEMARATETASVTYFTDKPELNLKIQKAISDSKAQEVVVEQLYADALAKSLAANPLLEAYVKAEAEAQAAIVSAKEAAKKVEEITKSPDGDASEAARYAEEANQKAIEAKTKYDEAVTNLRNANQLQNAAISIHRPFHMKNDSEKFPTDEIQKEVSKLWKEAGYNLEGYELAADELYKAKSELNSKLNLVLNKFTDNYLPNHTIIEKANGNLYKFYNDVDALNNVVASAKKNADLVAQKENERKLAAQKAAEQAAQQDSQSDTNLLPAEASNVVSQTNNQLNENQQGNGPPTANNTTPSTNTLNGGSIPNSNSQTTTINSSNSSASVTGRLRYSN